VTSLLKKEREFAKKNRTVKQKICSSKTKNKKSQKYVIISTYPQEGSKNIGDNLITTSLIEAIKKIKGNNVSFEVILRTDTKENFLKKSKDADAVIFACLGIRNNIYETYPYIESVLKSKLPFAVVSAGTALDIALENKNIFSSVSNETKSLLKKIDNRSVFFSTRGYLTQFFCENIGLRKSHFTGDIAFYDDRFSGEKFSSINKIKKIAISDPHRAILYLNSIKNLYDGLKSIFPNAKIEILLHGINPVIENFSKNENIKYIRIYENKNSGLNLYDKYDLHIGYRVHGHVSALVRRKPSYLLEQDGRGCDYGLSLNRKISVLHPIKREKNLTKILKKLYLFSSGINFLKTEENVSISPVSQILSIVNEDRKNSFVKFKGLENQIIKINRS
jgi:hypothetical protein